METKIFIIEWEDEEMGTSFTDNYAFKTRLEAMEHIVHVKKTIKTMKELEAYIRKVTIK